MRLEGIHHVTAISGDARRNLDFYVRVLGLAPIRGLSENCRQGGDVLRRGLELKFEQLLCARRPRRSKQLGAIATGI